MVFLRRNILPLLFLISFSFQVHLCSYKEKHMKHDQTYMLGLQTDEQKPLHHLNMAPTTHFYKIGTIIQKHCEAILLMLSEYQENMLLSGNFRGAFFASAFAVAWVCNTFTWGWGWKSQVLAITLLGQGRKWNWSSLVIQCHCLRWRKKGSYQRKTQKKMTRETNTWRDAWLMFFLGKPKSLISTFLTLITIELCSCKILMKVCECKCQKSRDWWHSFVFTMSA